MCVCVCGGGGGVNKKEEVSCYDIHTKGVCPRQNLDTLNSGWKSADQIVSVHPIECCLEANIRMTSLFATDR